ncbi:MAG TPA: DUF1127 domain-containing protein [Alphaproteobacteria bacterium]|jgi:uncharacterized protein YjiS (DUF1127 family)
MSMLNPYSGPAAVRPPAPSLQSALAWLASSRLLVAAKRFAAALVEARQAKLASEELRGWDDHMLRDIGLQRMDIDAAVRGRLLPLPREAETGRKPPQPYC